MTTFDKMLDALKKLAEDCEQARLAILEAGKRRVIVREGVVAEDFIEIEDNGRAMIAELDEGDGCDNNGLFLKLHSWENKDVSDSATSHEELKSLIGKKIKVTIEVSDG